MTIMQLTLALGVASAFLFALVSAVQLKDIVIIQSGTTHGGCDNYMDALNLWHEEAIFSLANAVTAVDFHYNDDSRLGRKIRKSMFSFFQVPQEVKVWGGPPEGTANVLSGNMNLVVTWLRGEKVVYMKRENNYLFCGSDFFVQRSPQEVAQDFKGDDMFVDGNPVPIESVPGYDQVIKKGNVAWWSGDRSDLNGYWFEAPTSGANYCRDPSDPEFDGENSPLALTGEMKVYTLTKTGEQKPLASKKQLIILCPRAFKTTKFHNSFKDAAASPQMKPGRDLEWALPRSATLTHEAFHIIYGKSFKEGNEETYGLGKCIELANSDDDPRRLKVASARKNPESFVYFSSALHYLTDPDLPKRWDFCENPGSARVFDPNSEDEEMGEA